MTLTATQALLSRRRGNVHHRAQAAPSSPSTAAADAATLDALKRGEVATLRAAAAGEIAKAKEAVQAASGLSGSAFVGLPVLIMSGVANYRRWRPVKVLIDEAEQSLSRGDETGVLETKRNAYGAAWSTARSAQTAVAREAARGKTGAGDVLKQQAEVMGVDAQKVEDAAVSAAKQAGNLADGIGSVVKVAATAAAIYGIAKVIGGLRS